MRKYPCIHRWSRQGYCTQPNCGAVQLDPKGPKPNETQAVDHDNRPVPRTKLGREDGKPALRAEIIDAVAELRTAERTLKLLLRKALENGFKMNELGELVGVARQTIARWCNS